MDNQCVTGKFNVQGIPQLDAAAKKAVDGALLVLIFDKTTDAKVVGEAVLEASGKTGISRFQLVSRETDASGVTKYEKTFVTTPGWSGDSYSIAAASPEGVEGMWRREFLEAIAGKWETLQKPATVKNRFTVDFTLASGMQDEDMQQAIRAGVEQALAKALEAGQKNLAQAENERSFDKAYDDPMVHKEICALSGDPAAVEAFAYFRVFSDLKVIAPHVVAAAKLLQIPSGMDFNATAFVAMPGEADTAAGERWQKATDEKWAKIKQLRAQEA